HDRLLRIDTPVRKSTGSGATPCSLHSHPMRRAPHPALFFALILPYGASFGYVSVAFPYIATHNAGLTAEQAGTLVAAAWGPHAIKFLWAPVVDTTLTKKAWYLIALAMVIAGTIASASVTIDVAHIPMLTTVIVASQIGLTLLNMAVESFLGQMTAAEKGR